MVTRGKNLKVHFIQHFEKINSSGNTGDWICSPYNYFIDFFSQYTCIVHSIWAVLWQEIEENDIVIYGGGGLLDNSNELNNQFNSILRKCRNVIIWGAGTHKYREDNIFQIPSADIPIDFDRAAFSGIRDFEHPYNQPFIPCVSCLHPAFDIEKSAINIERNIGVIASALENSFIISNAPSTINNALPIGAIVEYILSSNIILTSTYHGAYWSQLLGRKVILPESRICVDKYRYFKYKVGLFKDEIFDEVKLLNISSGIPEQLNFLNEARALNMEFFIKVRNFIEERIYPSSAPHSLQILSKRIAQLEFSLIEALGTINKLKSDLS